MSIFQRLFSTMSDANADDVADAMSRWWDHQETEQDIALLREYYTHNQPHLLAVFQAAVTARRTNAGEHGLQIVEIAAEQVEQRQTNR
jgi:hypothetical protein